jgi:hypothetical protein
VGLKAKGLSGTTSAGSGSEEQMIAGRLTSLGTLCIEYRYLWCVVHVSRDVCSVQSHVSARVRVRRYARHCSNRNAMTRGVRRCAARGTKNGRSFWQKFKLLATRQKGMGHTSSSPSTGTTVVHNREIYARNLCLRN